MITKQKREASAFPFLLPLMPRKQATEQIYVN